MHDYRKFKVSVNGRIGRTARLSERLRRYVTSNPASPATRRRATPTTSPTWPRSCRPCAMRARTTWSSSAPGVLERLLAVGGLGEQHPHAGLSTQRAQHRQRRRLLALLRPKQPAVRGQALAGVARTPVAFTPTCPARPIAVHSSILPAPCITLNQLRLPCYSFPCLLALSPEVFTLLAPSFEGSLEVPSSSADLFT